MLHALYVHNKAFNKLGYSFIDGVSINEKYCMQIQSAI